MRYIALVDGKAGAYGVVVPDLPGCTSAGSTTDEALRNAVEAVRLWVDDAIDAGEALPPPLEEQYHGRICSQARPEAVPDSPRRISCARM